MSQQASEIAARHADVESKVDHGDKLARLKYEANKRRMIQAYDNRGTLGDAFLDTVREFATIKLRYLEYEFAKTGTYTTVDDYAQEVVIAVWEKLPSFRGNTGEAFYSWVNRIAYVKAAKFFNVLLDKKFKYTTLTVTGKDEDGDEEEIDNPELWSTGYDRGIRIPESVTGLDRLIFSLMLTERFDPERPNYVAPGSRVLNPDNPKGAMRGMNYAEVAATLRVTPAPAGEDWSGMTPGAVEARVRRVRNRLKREREERDRARVKAEKTIEVVPERPSWEPKIADSPGPVTIYYENGKRLSHPKRLPSNAAEVTA
jgi:DNA-directed RNA polymerase specialized sigma24 family protein